MAAVRARTYLYEWTSRLGCSVSLAGYTDPVSRYFDAQPKEKGFYKEGRRFGEWSFFYPNGKVMSTGEYTRGAQERHVEILVDNG